MNDLGGSTAPLTRRLQILLALARSDLHIRYGRGRGQLIQWIVDPFALVGVYLLLRVMFGAGGTAPGLSLACAVVPFQIILFSCISAMSAVSLREPILMNMDFNRMLIPPSSVVTESLAFAASFIMFPIAMIIYGVGPQLSLLWLPVIVAVALTLAMGAAWPAALIGLWFPAVRTLAAQGLRLLFFAAPGIVALSEVSPDVKRWIVYNPFTGLFEAFRHVFVYGDSPAFWQLAYPTAVGLALALVFVPLYRREERHFAKLVGDN
jgi:ABC-type polysaccharide/polyol phosphate export permease